MLLQLGALFLLGSLSMSSALPPCVCTKNLSPVCGSDGQTYSNKCMLQCAQVSNPELFIERTGRCDGSSLGPPRVVRQIQGDCTFCTLEYMPFCGTDGNTYPNRCTLNCAKRTANVEVSYPGVCRSKRDIEQAVQLPSRCSCPSNFAPVCGTDDNTYDNECSLDCMSQGKPKLRLQYVGSCVNEVKSCSCSQEKSPVCGTDGNTYENPCFLKCAKENNKDLDTLYVGECDSNIRVVECDGCTQKVRPMCGTDGNTYRNPCMLNCVRENEENLHIDYVGRCDSRLSVVESQICDGCTRKVKPVCGTDGNTYRNPCLLNCARENNEYLHIDYEGPCVDMVKVVEEAENFSCNSCTKILEPVCASNGVTFSNKCLMKCANTHLSVANEGSCEE